jgi:hypothetical protein
MLENPDDILGGKVNKTQNIVATPQKLKSLKRKK